MQRYRSGKLFNFWKSKTLGFYAPRNFRSSASRRASFNCFSIALSLNISILAMRDERITSEIDEFSALATSHSWLYIVGGTRTAQVISLCSRPRPRDFLGFDLLIVIMGVVVVVCANLYIKLYTKIELCKFYRNIFARAQSLQPKTLHPKTFGLRVLCNE